MSAELVLNTEYGRLYHGDCLPWMKSMEPGSVDLVFADPPFNLGKDYGKGINDKLKDEDYLNWTYEWLDAAVNLLSPGGAIWVYNIPKWNLMIGAYLMGKSELMFRHQVAVSMKMGLPIPGKLSPAHYSLLYFTKGKPRTFTRPRTPIELCRHCGGEIHDYGGHRNKMNPAGVNLTDVWTDLSPVRHRKDKRRAANALPEKMLERVLTISSDTGDTVLDPFGGSGTTYAVAERMQRKWLGIELGDTDPIERRLTGREAVFEMPAKGDARKGGKNKTAKPMAEQYPLIA